MVNATRYERMTELYGIFRNHHIDMNMSEYGNALVEIQLAKPWLHFGFMQELKESGFSIEAISFKSNILIVNLGAKPEQEQEYNFEEQEQERQKELNKKDFNDYSEEQA
jgi:hypothetical protein